MNTVDTGHEDMIVSFVADVVLLHRMYICAIFTSFLHRSMMRRWITTGQGLPRARLIALSKSSMSREMLRRWLPTYKSEYISRFCCCLKRMVCARKPRLLKYFHGDRCFGLLKLPVSNYPIFSCYSRHEGPVWQVAWAHPMYGNILASCSYDRKVIIWKEISGQWKNVHEHANHDSSGNLFHILVIFSCFVAEGGSDRFFLRISVNSVNWAPQEFGLILVCGSSDGAVSVLTSSGDGSWETQKINNAHTVRRLADFKFLILVSIV